ncbi:hypothetical protein VULLAG_LOCUS9354 [Vulpes lagopus]
MLSATDHRRVQGSGHLTREGLKRQNGHVPWDADGPGGPSAERRESDRHRRGRTLGSTRKEQILSNSTRGPVVGRRRGRGAPPRDPSPSLHPKPLST